MRALIVLSLSAALFVACSSDDGSDVGPTGGGAGGSVATGGAGGSVATGGQAVGGGAAGGSGGQGGASERLECKQTCTPGANDCVGGTSCNVAGRCEFADDTSTCAKKEDCIPSASFWNGGTACTNALTDCSTKGGQGVEPLEACIKVSGSGHCVRLPSKQGTCSNSYFKPLPWTDIDGKQVSVCGRDTYVCEDLKCVAGCTDDPDCSIYSRPVCNQATGKCGCSATSCGSSNDGTVCKSDGFCGCSDDSHCPTLGFDRCYDGQCGCSGTDACKELLPSLSVICEA